MTLAPLKNRFLALLAALAALPAQSFSVNAGTDATPVDAVAWWPAENSGEDMIGTADGALMGSVGFVDGKRGRAFHFADNSANYVSIPDGAITDLPAAFSLETWVRPLAGLSNPSTAYGVFSKAAPPFPAGISYQMVLPAAADNDAVLQTHMRSAAQGWPANSTTGGLLDVGIWSHVVWTYDGSASTLFVDGAAVSSTTPGALILANVDTELRLNCDAYGSVCSPLDLDEAVIYHRALAPAEILTRYRALAAQEVTLPYRQDMGGALDAHWQVVNRQAPTLQFQPDGSLRMTTTTTDLYGPTNNIANMPVLRLPAGGGDFAVTAAFRFDAAPTLQYQQAGVLVLGENATQPDQDNYLRNSYAIEPVRRFEAIYDVAGVPNPDIPNGPLVDLPVGQPYWMQIARHGNNYTLSYSRDGERYQDFYSVSPAITPAYAGLFALHSTAAPPPTTFDVLNFDVSTPCLGEPSGLVSHWQAGSGDDLAGRNPLTAVNAAGHEVARVGRGFSLNGTDQYFANTTTLSVPLAASARSLTLWAKTPRNLSADTETGLFQYGTDAGGQMFGLITSGNAPGKLYFYGNSADLAGATTLLADTWYHLAVTYDGTTVRLYVNGQPDGSAAIALNTALSANGLNIGRRWPSNFWWGLIDDVQLYARALSSVEIAAIHASGGAGLCLRDGVFANGFE